MIFYNLSFSLDYSNMFNKNTYAMLQLLHDCAIQIEIQNNCGQQHRGIHLYSNHILNKLKTAQASLRQQFDHLMRIFSKIDTKICSFQKRQNEESQEISNKDLNLQQLQNFINQALAYRKLAQIPYYSQQSCKQLNQSYWSQFPALQTYINHRRQSITQIQLINHNLQILQHTLHFQNSKQQKTLESIIKRLENINISISQTQKQSRRQNRYGDMSDFIKQHNQTHQIVNHILYGNICFLEEIASQMQSGQLKTSINKIIEQIRKCDQHIQNIYSFLREVGQANKLELNNRFLKNINYIHLSQKLSECTKLIAFLKIQSVLQIGTSKKSSQFENTFKTPIKYNYAQEVRQNITENDAQYFQQQILLLQQQENIYELQEQLEVLKQQIGKLQAQKNQKANQIVKLNQQNSTLLDVCKEAKAEIQNMSSKQNQLVNQCQKSIQNISWLQEENKKLSEQLANQLQQNNGLSKLNQMLTHENWHSRATIDQQKAMIEQNNQKSHAALTQINQVKNTSKELQLQIQTNQQLVYNLKLTIKSMRQQQQTQQIKQNQQRACNSLQHQSNIYQLQIIPIHKHHSNCQQAQSIQKKNTAELPYQESLSQATSNIEQQVKGKLKLRHSKTFSGQHLNEFMSQNLSKKEEHVHSNDSEQHKNSSNKDNTIKKYEIYIGRYKHETKRYQKQILQLQAKTRKLQMQILQLNQIVQEQTMHKELLSIEEEPTELHNLEISQDLMQQNDIEKLTEKEAELRVKEESINFKIQGIINTVLQLNAFKTETKLSTQTSIADAELYELGLDSFNPQSHS